MLNEKIFVNGVRHFGYNMGEIIHVCDIEYVDYFEGCLNDFWIADITFLDHTFLAFCFPEFASPQHDTMNYYLFSDGKHQNTIDELWQKFDELKAIYEKIED